MNINKLIYDPEDFGITKYEWRTDGKLDVFQNVELSSRGLDSLPFSFGKVEGVFEAHNNNLDESSILDLPESCKALFLFLNKFKNLNKFHTKTDEIGFSNNPLESIEGIKHFKINFLYLKHCDQIKDWDNLPFVEDYLSLESSSIESLDCLKNKNLETLNANNTKIESVCGLSVKFLTVERTNIKTLIDLETCPMFLCCDKDKENQFINELKQIFPTSFNLNQVSWKRI